MQQRWVFYEVRLSLSSDGRDKNSLCIIANTAPHFLFTQVSFAHSNSSLRLTDLDVEVVNPTSMFVSWFGAVLMSAWHITVPYRGTVSLKLQWATIDIMSRSVAHRHKMMQIKDSAFSMGGYNDVFMLRGRGCWSELLMHRTIFSLSSFIGHRLIQHAEIWLLLPVKCIMTWVRVKYCCA